MRPIPGSVDDLTTALGAHAYLADRGLSTAIYLSLSLGKPLLLEGEAGVGKTEVAKVLAELLDRELIRLQCYEGIDAAQALYDWDFPRQLLHLRAAEAAGRAGDAEALEGELYSRRFLLARRYRAVEGGAVPPLIVAENWFTELRQKVGR